MNRTGWLEEIRSQLAETAAVQQLVAEHCADAILAAAALIAGSLERGGKLMLCGNGGSAADSQHIAAELVGRMSVGDRPALPALALTTDTAALTALGNDFGYGMVFRRQVEALARPGDVLVGMSTSGRSPNVLLAVEAAARLDVSTVGLTGENGSPLAAAVEIAVRVPSSNPQRIQEAHLMIGHVICHLVEQALTGGGGRGVEWLTGQARG